MYEFRKTREKNKYPLVSVTIPIVKFVFISEKVAHTLLDILFSKKYTGKMYEKDLILKSHLTVI
jgi:hypothetical protein